MAYDEFKGNSIYTIDTTGDVCAGDEICFERATFSGSFRKPIFNGFELVEGIVIRESYGEAKQQHTFTIRTISDNTIHIKGRNLYKNGVWRKLWSDEDARTKVLNEKHSRGDKARSTRYINKMVYSNAIKT